MHGALVIHAKKRVDLPINLRQNLVSGFHIPGRENGKFWVPTTPDHTVYVPQRDKTLNMYLEGDCSLSTLESLLVSIDTPYDGLNFSQKLNQLVLTALPGSYAVVVNTMSTHGHISYLATDIPIYSSVVKTPAGLLFIWTTEDLETMIHAVRSEHPIRDTFVYRFPPIVNTAVFLNVQSTCSKWYNWMKVDTLETIHRLCALEQLIFKRLSLVPRSWPATPVCEKPVSALLRPKESD